jgi:hypothetical protein
MIRKYKCPECKGNATNEEWDRETERVFGRYSVPINRAFRDKDILEGIFFSCIHCLKNSEIHRIKRVRS